LREPDVSGLSGKAPEIAATVEQADSALRTGDNGSPEDANQVLEKAFRLCLVLGGEDESAALILARQAQIAAVKQEYPRASELYADAAATPGLAVQLQWQYQITRALVLEELGREFMDNTALEQATDLYETTILELAPRNERPEDWAATRNQFGSVLGILGERQRGTQMLERSITAFKDALSERSRERVPLDWATTQNNLAAALQTLGHRKNDTQLLKKSVEAYKNVLRVWTREEAPLDWASTLNNLGSALRLLGERRKVPRTLEQSVAACNSALAEQTRDRVPEDWAMTQNNLGAAVQRLGERQGDPQILEQSIAAYGNAPKVWTRGRTPMSWAMTMANLAVARKTLPEQTKDVEIARQAVTDFEAVSEVFRNASHAQCYELSEEQRAKTLKIVAELGGGCLTTPGDA
jgi:tetratricopeptide (TPR) repeat protein